MILWSKQIGFLAANQLDLEQDELLIQKLRTLQL